MRADNVVREFEVMLTELIDCNSDDIHDRASWVAALDVMSAKLQRNITAEILRTQDRLDAPRTFTVIESRALPYAEAPRTRCGSVSVGGDRCALYEGHTGQHCCSYGGNW